MRNLVNEYRTIRKTRENQANIEKLQKMSFHLRVSYKITSLNQAILETEYRCKMQKSKTGSTNIKQFFWESKKYHEIFLRIFEFPVILF